MDDPTTQFCTSWFVIQVANVGVALFISSWNQHPIPGMIFFFIKDIQGHTTILYSCSGRKNGMPRGIPDSLMMRDNRAKRIDVNILPSPDEAVHMYVADGGTLTDSGPFGTDPITEYERLPNTRDFIL